MTKGKRVKVLEGLLKEQRDAVVEVILATMSDWEYRSKNDHRLSTCQRQILSGFTDKLSRLCTTLIDQPQRVGLDEDDYDLLYHVLMDYVDDYNSIAQGLPFSMRTAMLMHHDYAGATASKLLSLPWTSEP